MILKDYDLMEEGLREAKTIQLKDQSVLSALMLLLVEAKSLLFPNGEYKKLKRFQIIRIWRMAKLAVRLINTLMAIFR